MVKKGFTLAEVLITLSIVGVISALTVPNLVGNASKKGQVALLRKAYLDLSEAIETELMEKDRATIGSLFSTDEKIQDFLKRHFKVTKNCGASTSGCLASEIVTMDGASITLPQNLNCITNAAGIAICMQVSTEKNVVMIDVNGTKDPNIKGRDVFALTYTNKGDLVDAIKVNGSYTDPYVTVSNDTLLTECKASTDIGGCFEHILNNNWTMEY
jgi:prepilin-type N-terminal cleavage/methylation domain-containing protein